MRTGDLTQLESARESRPVDSNDGGVNKSEARPQKLTTRQWLAQAQRVLGGRLPPIREQPLLTDDLVDSAGRPVDVYAHFDLDPKKLNSLFENFFGLTHTAQLCATKSYIEQPPPAWPGFQDIWIPIRSRLSLAARLGLAAENDSRDAAAPGQRGANRNAGDGRVRDATCIVILPGFLGDNGVNRTRDLARALHAAGYHVLALESRAHGQVEKRYPDEHYTFGARETADLMLVSEWLERQPHIRNTGLIGFCWGANEALMASWFDGGGLRDPSIAPKIAKLFPSISSRPHFSAGVMAFSPSLRWEELLDACDIPHSKWTQPALAGLQNYIRERMQYKRYSESSGSLRRLIEFEFSHTELPTLEDVRDAYTLLRLLPYRDLPAGDKLEAARVPTLIVQAANDPLVPAQAVADIIAMTQNPMVAAIVLPRGGHIGFAAWAREYYFSLIVNYFDPVVGAAAACGAALTHSPARTDRSMAATTAR